MDDFGFLIYATQEIPCGRAARQSQIVRMATIAFRMLTSYSWHVNRLTKQEQLVLCIVLGLLLTGWAVKTYRAAHPAPLPVVETKL
jgi:hypothetical protein